MNKFDKSEKSFFFLPINFIEKIDKKYIPWKWRPYCFQEANKEVLTPWLGESSADGNRAQTETTKAGIGNFSHKRKSSWLWQMCTELQQAIWFSVLNL